MYAWCIDRHHLGLQASLHDLIITGFFLSVKYRVKKHTILLLNTQVQYVCRVNQTVMATSNSFLSLVPHKTITESVLWVSGDRLYK